MKLVTRALSICAVLLVTACTGATSNSTVDALNEAQAVGSPFTKYLSAEYRDYANMKQTKFMDYADALHFARKGLAAAAGEAVMPEPVTDWNLDDGDIQELSAARGRLIVAYDLGAREVAPREAAHAQAMYDCWIEQEEEDWQDEDILNCKNAYNDAINKLEGMLQPPPAEPAPAPVAEPMAPEDAVYLVFFNWDSKQLGSGALNVLDAVAAEVAKNPPSQVNIIGHADTSGPQTYNQKLAFSRANKVRDALVERGVNANIIMVDSKGENELLVETPDNVREPANRRVNITFQ